MEAVRLTVNGQDLSSLWSTMTISGSYTSVARELSFDIISSPTDTKIPVVDLPTGSEVSVTVGGHEVYYGHVYDKETSIQSSTDPYTCYDPLYVMIHEDSNVTFNFKNTTPDSATAQICEKIGLSYGGADNTGDPINRIFEDVNAYDAMMTMWTLQSKKDGKKYMPIILDRQVYIVEKGKTIAKYIQDPATSILNANYKESAKILYGTDKILDKNNNEIGKLGEVADQSASLDLLGDLNCITGMGVVVNEPYTGLYGLFYIDSDTHTFQGGKYETSLDIAFENMMDERDVDSAKKNDNRVGSGSYSGGMVGDTVQEQVWSFFLDKGYSKESIAAILGNMYIESGFDPNVTGDGGTSYGLCQWHAGRWDSLKNWCNSNGYDWQTVEGQLNFLHHELQTSYNGEYFMQMTDVNQATDWFTSNYEIPNEAVADRAGRKDYANRMYEEFYDWEPPRTEYISQSGEMPASHMADGALSAGEEIIGTRYLWGGNSPSTGIDCSGFVQWVYNQNGANIPGRLTTSELARSPGYYGFKKIPWSEMQPGDVVYTDGHVGMYYGDGKTIESGGTSSKVLGYSGVAVTDNLNYFDSVYRYVGW